MNTPIKDGGPAFPRAGFLSAIEKPEQLIAQYENKPELGMTLRDYLAAQALPRATIGGGGSASAIAARAYFIADAMLAARQKGQP